MTGLHSCLELLKSPNPSPHATQFTTRGLGSLLNGHWVWLTECTVAQYSCLMSGYQARYEKAIAYCGTLRVNLRVKIEAERPIKHLRSPAPIETHWCHGRPNHKCHGQLRRTVAKVGQCFHSQQLYFGEVWYENLRKQYVVVRCT